MPGSQGNARSGFSAIQRVDYTVIFARDLPAMRRFYEDVLGFAVSRELSPRWIEYQIGDNTLTLTTHTRRKAMP